MPGKVTQIAASSSPMSMPELERVGGDHREQLAGRQPGLDLAALLGRVAGPVGGDPLGELRATELLEPGAGKALDQLDARAGCAGSRSSAPPR